MGRLSEANQKLVDTAKARGYLVARRGNWPVHDAYWRWCEQQRRPFVHCAPKRVTALVCLDMDTTSTLLSADARAAQGRMIGEYLSRYASGYSYGNYTRIPNCPIEHAEALARAIYEIAIADIGLPGGDE